MNKAELVETVQKALGGETSKAAAERCVDAVVEGIKKGLKGIDEESDEVAERARTDAARSLPRSEPPADTRRVATTDPVEENV